MGERRGEGTRVMRSVEIAVESGLARVRCADNCESIEQTTQYNTNTRTRGEGGRVCVCVCVW